MSDVTITAKVYHAHLLEPIRFPRERKAYYRCDVLIPKSEYARVLELSTAIQEVTGADRLSELLKDGDAKDIPEYKGCYFFSAKRTHEKPLKVDVFPIRKKTDTPFDCDNFDGREARLELSIEHSKRKAVSCRLDKVTIL